LKRVAGSGWRVGALALALWLAHDLLVPTPYALDARVAMFAIDQYRALVSPRISGVVQCRFTPTCSMYGRESIRKYGFIYGGIRTIGRIARCGSWTPLGTVDPP
jgi:putative membrane protein insertion efficiency factor